MNKMLRPSGTGNWGGPYRRIFCEVVKLGDMPARFRYWNQTTAKEECESVPIACVPITPAEAERLEEIMLNDVDPCLGIS